jgi:hypothetical protein
MTIPKTKLMLMAALLVTMGGWLCLYWYTASVGCATSPDSAGYLAGAISLRTGGAYLGYDGCPLVVWPPAYSLLLAGGSVVAPLTPNGSPIVVGWLLYAISLGTMWLLLKHLSLRPWLCLCLFSMAAFSSTLLLYMGALLSEGMFIALILLFALAATKELDFVWRFIWLAALAAMATLTRYIGVALYPLMGMVLVWYWAERPRRTRPWLFLTVASALATFPVVLLFWRNVYFTGALTGRRGQPLFGTVENIRSGLDVITQFLLPARIPVLIRMGVLVLMAVGILDAFRLQGRSSRPVDSRQRRLPILCATWCLGYFALLTLLASVGYMDAFDFRLMSPLLLPGLLLLGWALDVQLRHRPSRWISGATMGICILLVAQIGRASCRERVYVLV